ncbi:enoyl-CoA hydratase/isomerase family protein [Streptomyces sp. BI20]|uniref:enoyl-CoA hydratase/isomerase family protein n=1 Tax=Streptomyces sp. BI20 TaxID=3403460 RepID=UPI003C77D953
MDEVSARVEGRAGRLTLNRPRALNALTHPMVRALTEALRAWESDPRVTHVVVDGAGERGLCAGGDIRAIHDDAKAGGGASAAFWADEYRLNAYIARYPKPYVALMDGIVMGGGVGVSAHGSVRVVTERSRIAMPETGIGFVPDVGGTWLLGRRAPGGLGTHLALTGRAVGAAEAIRCGLADHLVPAGELDALRADLAELPAAEAVARHARPVDAGEAREAKERAVWIDACHDADTVEGIVAALRAHGDPEAAAAADTLLTRSPVALKVTLESLRRARGLDRLERALEREYGVSVAALTEPDLVEGIRAQVVDKDRSPRWSPASLAEVDAGRVARFFAPPPAGTELRLG